MKRRCCVLLSSTYKQIRYINTTRLLRGNQNKDFTKTSFVEYRSTVKSKLDKKDETITENSQNLKFIPHYISYLTKKGFNERTFCVSLSTIFINVKNGVIEESKVQIYMEQLKHVFIANIENITQLNTIFTTLKKFVAFGITLPREVLDQLGKKAANIAESSDQKFADYGSSITYLLRSLIKSNSDNPDVLKRLNRVLIKNIQRIQINYLLGAFCHLCDRLDVLTSKDLEVYFDFFFQRKQLFSMLDLDKLIRGIHKIAPTVKEDKALISRIVKFTNEILQNVHKRDIEYLKEDYLSFLFLKIHWLDIKELLGIEAKTSNETDETLAQIDKEIISQIKNPKVEVIEDYISLIDYIRKLSSSSTAYISIPDHFKRQFIESLILTMDIRHNEIRPKDMKLLFSYLTSENSFISKEKINCYMRTTSFMFMSKHHEVPSFIKISSYQEIQDRDRIQTEYYDSAPNKDYILFTKTE